MKYAVVPPIHRPGGSAANASSEPAKSAIDPASMTAAASAEVMNVLRIDVTASIVRAPV
jgi:hypothetical protein